MNLWRKLRRLVWIAAGLLAGLCLAVAMFKASNRRLTKSEENACVGNMCNMRSAIEQWATEKGIRRGSPVDMAIVGTKAYMPYGIQACPSGGRYVVGRIGEFVSCTIHSNWGQLISSPEELGFGNSLGVTGQTTNDRKD